MYFNSSLPLWTQPLQLLGMFLLHSGLPSTSPSHYQILVALGTFPREAPTKRQSSLHGLTLLTAILLSALELLKEAIDKAGYTDKIVIGMDVAASEFYRDGKYDLDFKSPDDPSRYISGDELGDLYQSFVRDYPGELLCGAVENQHWGCTATRHKPSVVLGWEGRQL